MKRSTLELWVGLFVALGIAATVFLSFNVARTQLGGQNSGTYTVYANFSDIGGLKTQAPVKAAGVVVGRVSAIGLDKTTYQAKVTLALDNRYPFSTDTSAQILTQGLLGEQYIGLVQGADNNNLKNGDTITITSSAMILEQLIGKFMTNAAEQNAAPSTPTGHPDAASAAQ